MELVNSITTLTMFYYRNRQIISHGGQTVTQGCCVFFFTLEFDIRLPNQDNRATNVISHVSRNKY